MLDVLIANGVVIDGPLRPLLDREPAPAQDGSGSAGDREADPTRRPVPGARSGVTGEAGGGAGPSRTPAAPAEVALIVPSMRQRRGKQ